MDLVVIAGFLGAGKTTLLLRTAAHLAQSGRKVAILENEAGTIGVDNEIVRGEGWALREILSGCICCTLRGDLVRTLLELEREFDPDVVVLEPSGVAGPHMVLDALRGYGGELDRIATVILFDGPRFARIRALSIPIIEQSLEVGDIVLINKADRMDEQAVVSLTEQLREKSECAPMPISAREGSIDAYLKMLVDRLSDPASSSDKPLPRKGGDAAYRDAVSVARVLSVTETTGPDDVEREVETLFTSLRDRLTQADAFIGHIKAVMKGKGAGYRTWSLTEEGEGMSAKGALSKQLGQARLHLNVVVLRIDKEAANRLVDESIRSTCNVFAVCESGEATP